jgi:CubicO group peptidase (beta-lactamase class C family)
VAPPGTRWNYSTGETNLVGVLLARATGQPLASYLSEKIWKPAGMEQQATWILSRTGQEISGCCIQAATRDFARFGQFFLDGARVAGQPSMAREDFYKAVRKAIDDEAASKPGG